MLKKDWIRKEIVHGTDEWHMGRLARLTASEWYRFMGEKPFTQGAMSYIYDKVGEESTGIPAKDEISTASTMWGQDFEEENLRMFMKTKGIEFLVTQRLIAQPDSRFGCTPDGIIVLKESEDKTAYQVETVECKTPPTYNKFISLALCNTPEDVKRVSSAYFYQVIHQMIICDALKGFLSVYHPKFSYGGFKIIEFRKIDMIPEFTLVTQRMKMAEAKFIEIREKLFNLKPQ